MSAQTRSTFMGATVSNRIMKHSFNTSPILHLDCKEVDKCTKIEKTKEIKKEMSGHIIL